MIDNSSPSKIIIKKVYQAKISSKSSPYIHTMHKVFHDKFYKQYDARYHNILISQFIKNINSNNTILNISSIKNQSSMFEEHSSSQNILGQLKQNNESFSQIIERNEPSTNVNRSEISKKSSQRLQEENKKIEMKKKNHVYQGNVTKSQLKRASIKNLIENVQEKKDKQQIFIQNKSKQQQKLLDKNMIDKNKQQEEQQQIQVVDEPSIYSLNKLVTKSNIQNVTRTQFKVDINKKSSSQIKQIKEINFLNQKQNILPLELHLQLHKNNDKLQNQNKDQQKVEEGLVKNKSQKLQIKDNIQKLNKVKLLPKFDSSIKIQSLNQLQNDIKFQFIPVSQNIEKNPSQKSGSSQNINNKAFISLEPSQSNSEKSDNLLLRNEKLNDNLQKDAFIKQNQSLYIDSPQTQSLKYDNQHSRQISDLDINNKSLVLDNQKQDVVQQSNSVEIANENEKKDENKQSQQHNQVIQKQSIQIQKIAQQNQQVAQEGLQKKQEDQNEVVQEQQQKVSSIDPIIVKSQQEPIIQLIPKEQSVQKDLDNMPEQQPQIQQQDTITQIFASNNQKQKDYPKQNQQNLQQQQNIPTPPQEFQKIIQNIINTFTISKNKIVSQQIQKMKRQQQQLALLRQQQINFKNQIQVIKMQNSNLLKQNQRLKGQSKLKTGQYQLKITVLNSYIAQLKQKLESQQFYAISQPNKAVKKRKKSQELIITKHISSQQQNNREGSKRTQVFASAVGTRKINNNEEMEGQYLQPQRQSKENKSQQDDVEKSSKKNSSELDDNCQKQSKKNSSQQDGNKQKSGQSNSSSQANIQKKISKKNSSQQNKSSKQ